VQLECVKCGRIPAPFPATRPLATDSISLIVTWTAFLLAFWTLELPLGIGSSYTYPAER